MTLRTAMLWTWAIGQAACTGAAPDPDDEDKTETSEARPFETDVSSTGPTLDTGSPTGTRTPTTEPCDEQRFHLDADGDGFGDPDDFIDSCEPVGTYDVTNGGDCCDVDAEAHPGQASFFAVADECGDYDYDCDDTEELWVATCERTTDCTSHWSWCPVPDCGVEWDLVQQSGAGGLCSASNVTATQRCR